MVQSVTLNDFRGFDNLSVPLSAVTMLTGTNGVGKTSVLEGLYCLFSETRLDVSPLSRYDKSISFVVNQSANRTIGVSPQHSYSYRKFWEECPSYGKQECTVEATEGSRTWRWKYKKAKLADLGNQLTMNNPIPVDSSTDFALWEWKTMGKEVDKKTKKPQDVNRAFSRAQILSLDGGLYLLPVQATSMSVCLYMDFASIRLQPQKLSFQTARELTKALNIINSHITDVRLSDMESGLSVVLDNKYEVSLGTIGNGAVTWASTLLAIFDIAEKVKQQQLEVPILVLIDEMGVGIHYSVMLDVWEYLNEFVAQNSNIQFVFTSHNDDCIRAYC